MKLFELEAVLSLNDASFAQGISNSKRLIQSLTNTTQTETNSIRSMLENTFSFSAGQLLADGFRQGLGFIQDFTADSITAASDLEEVRNVIDVTFGQQAADMYNWASTSKEAFGMSTLAALEYAGEIGAVLKTQGFGAEETRDMSKAIVELAADYASFRNMDFSETFAMLRSGLRGETESIERLGLSVHVATMMDYLGLEKETEYTKAMTQAEQIQARYDYIMEKSAFVQGDFARTSGSFANELRTLNTNIQDLKTSLGDDLLPVATGFLQFLNFFFEDSQTAEEAVDGLRTSFSENSAAIESTTANALALVEALKELEQGGMNSEEESEWTRLVSKLLTDIPALGEKIPDTTAALQQGAEAIEAYVNSWHDMAVEAGRNEVLSGYYTQLGEAQALYAKEKYEYEDMLRESEAQKSLYTQTWTDALNYLQSAYGETPFTAEEVSKILSADSGINTAMQSLNALANRGDVGARTYYDVLASLERPEDLDRQLGIERNEMDQAQLELQSLENQLQVLTDAISTLDKKALDKNDPAFQDVESENSGISSDAAASLQALSASLSGIEGRIAAACREGVASGVGSISVTGSITTGNVTLNTGALVGQLTPRLNLALGTAGGRG